MRGGTLDRLPSQHLGSIHTYLRTCYAVPPPGGGNRQTAMAYVAGALASTMRPWRSLYAFSCCCLLPLSAALRPAGTTATRPGAFARAASSTRFASGRRSSGQWTPAAGSTSSWAPAETPRGSTTSVTQQRRASSGRLFGGGGGCVGVTGARSPLMHSSPSSSSSSRAFSGGKRPKVRGRGWGGGGTGGGGTGRTGGALGMGKGLDRKKAKKEQV